MRPIQARDHAELLRRENNPFAVLYVSDFCTNCEDLYFLLTEVAMDMEFQINIFRVHHDEDQPILRVYNPRFYTKKQRAAGMQEPDHIDFEGDLEDDDALEAFLRRFSVTPIEM